MIAMGRLIKKRPLMWAFLGLLLGCSPPTYEYLDTDTDSDSDTDTDEVEPFELLEGLYRVETVETPPNDCQADFSYMEGRDLRMWVDGESLDIEGILMQRDGNKLSGTDSERRDWSGIGADCVTDMTYTFMGDVLADGRFTWDWEATWAYVSGDGCDEALGHELPCTYWGLFTMQYQGPLN